MNDQLGSVSLDRCGNMLELEARSPGCATGLSILISADQFAALIVRAETLEPMRAYRERALRETAKEAASHAARASRMDTP